MKIIFPDKKQAKETFENVLRFTTKYHWKPKHEKKTNIQGGKRIEKFLSKKIIG